MKRIVYNPLAIDRIAGECRDRAEGMDISRTVMMTQMESHSGSMREQMDRDIISSWDMMRNTQELLAGTAEFLSKLSVHLEEQDRNIATRLGE